VTLWLVRHGVTAHNAGTPGAERIRGWSPVGLAPEGRAMATRVGEALKAHPPAVIFTSDLPRARETADLVAEALGGDVPVVPLAELRTWHVGSLSGQTLAAAKPALDRLQHTRPDEAAPRGGESYHDFFDRWGRLQAELRALGQTHDVLAVVHGRHLWALPAHLAGRGSAGVPTSGGPAPGDVLAVDEQRKRLVPVHRSGVTQNAS